MTVPTIRYYTRRKDVLLGPGQVPHFTKGKGYYAYPPALKIGLTADKTSGRVISAPANAATIEWARTSNPTSADPVYSPARLALSGTFAGTAAKPYIDAIAYDSAGNKIGDVWAGRILTTQVAPPPPPPPPNPPVTGQLLGAMGNVGDGGNLSILVKLGAKITREDSTSAFAQILAAGMKIVQNIPLGGTGQADGRAFIFQFAGNEPYDANVNPATYFPQALADLRALHAAHKGILCAMPVLAFGWSPFGGVDGNQYTYNGVKKPWVDWIAQYAPELFAEVDLWEVHPYGPQGLAQMDTVRAQLANHDALQPFIVGEDGYSTYEDTEQAQADYLTARIAAIKQRTDTLAWILYRGTDLVGQSDPRENNYGVEKTNSDWSDGGPKLAFALVQAVFKANA